MCSPLSTLIFGYRACLEPVSFLYNFKPLFMFFLQLGWRPLGSRDCVKWLLLDMTRENTTIWLPQ